MTISTKFSIGDEAWFIYDDKAVKQQVNSIYVSGVTQSPSGTHCERDEKFYGIFYKFDYEPTTHLSHAMNIRRIEKREDRCFATKEELIASL